jgi:ABC-type spermidine/putrescine transport system permease subunit I
MATAVTVIRRRTETQQRINAIVGYLMIAPPLLIMVFLIFYPALQAAVRTIFIENETTGASTFSLERYTTFFQSTIAVNNLLYTLVISVITIAILFVLCFPISIYLRFSKTRVAGAVQILVLFPLFVPGIILSFSLIRFLGTRGTVDTVLALFGIRNYVTPYLKPSGIIIGLVWEQIPFTTLVLTAGLRAVDDALIESARDVGAGNWTIFSRILLPLIQRPALIVFCLNFIGVFGAYTIPYLLGPAAPQMMGVYMQQTYSDYLDKPGAETQAVITFLFSAVVGILYVRTVAMQRGERK